MRGKARKLDGSSHKGTAEFVTCCEHIVRDCCWIASKWTKERMDARTNERTHDGSHGFVCFCIQFFRVYRYTQKNWAPSTWMVFVFRICCYLCCFAFCCWFFFSNHKCANRFKTPSTHDVLITAEWPKEWTNDRRKARTNKWTLKPDWNIIGKSVANLGRPPKTPSYLSFGALGRDVERV